MSRTRLVVPTTGGGAAADEMRRLMPRDLWLLDLLADHHTFTTDQIAALAFPTLTKARRRLRILRSRGLLDRFRHAVRPGSQSWRWTLAPAGAAIAALRAGRPVPRPAAVRAATDRLATNPRLAHLLGVNQVMVALAAHARHHPGTHLAAWWSEPRATRATGGLARPDAAGIWVAGERRVAFWLEYDTGTEPLSRVVAKLAGYARLAATDAARPVLLWLPATTRETHLHHAVTRAHTADHLTVATATTQYGVAGPAGPVWRLVGQTRRRALADIPTTPPKESAMDGGVWDG